jgi:hypothetical protein
MEAVEEVEMVPVVVTTPVEVVVEAATVLVKVVEAEPSSGTCRHSAQEVHSVRPCGHLRGRSRRSLCRW